MSENEHPKLDDLLERTLAAMRNEQLPPGPSAQTFANTLSALRGAGEPLKSQISNFKFTRRVIAMIKAHRIAATFILMLSGVAVYLSFVLAGGLASVSFAQVAEQVRSIHSMTCTVSAERSDKLASVSLKEMFMAPGKTRMETPNGMTIIADSQAHRSVLLNRIAKTATVMNVTMQNSPATRPSAQGIDMIEFFKNLAGNKADPMPDRRIGEVNAKGFHVNYLGVDQVVYVDPKSAMPIEVDMDMGQAMGTSKIVISDFNFDANLDPALFSLDVPTGYTVRTSPKVEMSGDLGQNVVPMLRAYASHKNNQFPAKIDDTPDIIATVIGNRNGRSDPAAVKLFSNMFATRAILSPLKKGVDWDYLPSGVKLGDADKIILWYKGSKTNAYKAIYGDLRIADVAADQLPKAGAPQGGL
jgi:outer membrane lipoprotein-sorting protein